MGIDIQSVTVYERVEDLFLLEGVVDDGIMQLLQLIRKNRTKSKQIFEDCLIYFSNRNTEIGVRRDTNIKEFEKRVRSLFRTNLAPPSVLTQLGSTLPSPRVTSLTVDNIVTEENIVDIIKTACQDEKLTRTR